MLRTDRRCLRSAETIYLRSIVAGNEQQLTLCSLHEIEYLIDQDVDPDDDLPFGHE